MAAPIHSKTFGLADLAVAPLVAEVPGALTDVPGIRSLELTLATDSEELRGDGAVISLFDKGSSAEFSMEEGGLSLDALEVMLALTAVEAGTGTTETRRLDILSTSQRPYFWLAGQARDDAIGDVHVVVWKAKLTGNIGLTFADEEFLTPTMEGRGVGLTATNLLVSIIQHETAAVLAVPA